MSFGKIKYTVGHILLNLFFLVICAAALIRSYMRYPFHWETEARR